MISALLSPFLGALADVQKSRKRWLAGCAGIGSVSTAALVTAGPQNLVITSLLFVLASTSFTLSLTFYHSFLNDLSTDQTIGRISGFGWAIGYIGGGICLAINLLMIQYPSWLGLPETDHWPVRATFLVVGVWWLVFTIPLLLWVKEPGLDLTKSSAASRSSSDWREASRRVMATVRSAGGFRKNLFMFLAAYLLYNDVIETVIVMASIFSAVELGMPQAEIVACFLMIQFVAFFGAVAFGRLADRWSNKRALQLTLIIWSGVILWTLLMKTRIEFWVAGFVIALVLGGCQSVSRSMFGKMIPTGEEAQFYGFMGLSGKISAAAGPLIFGLVHELTGQIRLAILSLLVLLILGQGLLVFVNESEKYDKPQSC